MKRKLAKRKAQIKRRATLQFLMERELMKLITDKENNDG